MDWILISLIALIILLLVVLYVRTRPRHVCPNCEAENTKEIDRDVAKTRYVEEMSTFGGGDGGTHVQNIYDVRYRCGTCGHVWVRQEVG